MFKTGQEYTRDEIHTHCGGSKQSYLPTVNGVVVAVCVTKALNPRAPEVIVCGQGPRIATAGAALAESKHVFPVFTKIAVNRWKYHGLFKVKASFSYGAEFENLVLGSGRSPNEVTCVVALEEAS